MISIKLDKILIPALGFGTWRLSGRPCVDAIVQALTLGYRNIDTAQIYENETEVGAGLKTSGISRADIFLTTKVWMDRVGAGALERSVDESLKKLQSDYVDLLLLHWPVANVPLAEQINALKSVQESGKAKLIGLSNYTVAMMKEARDVLGAPVVTNQVEYHPYLSQKPVLDYIRSHDMFLTAYSPLARGKVQTDPLLARIGQKYGKTPGQIALRWLVQQERVAAIPKAASLANMKANIDIFDFSLDQDEMNAIHALARPDGRIINPDWSPAWDRAA